MGASNSKIFEELPTKAFLQIFVSNKIIPDSSPFWPAFLAFQYKQLPIEKDLIIFVKSESLCNQLVKNNLKTGNFGTLIRFFLDRLSNVFETPNKVIPSCATETINALVLIRHFLQHLIVVHKYSENEIIKHIDFQVVFNSSQKGPEEPLFKKLIDNLMLVIIGFPVLDSSISLIIECINVLLVFLSLELFTTEPVSDLRIYNTIFHSENATNICNNLLSKFVEEGRIQNQHGSIFFGLADLVNIFIAGSDNESLILSRHSVLLLIVLVNQYKADPNPFRDTLSSISNDFPKLYKRISSTVEKEESTLLLYHLLHRNEKFRTFILEQPDIETLVVPMLKTIYNANDSSCDHMYMSLIILLILTEDTNFNRKVHRIVLKNISWYTDRNLGQDMTLGGLIILVTTRTVQYNLLKMKDEYLHTNCLAALANMSSQFSNLHTYVCQRLVGLFEVLAKTYNRAEMLTIEKALRIILEVLNSCLANQLMHNTNLVYTLLYKKHVFETFCENPAFQDIICNINQVLDFFISKIDSQEEPCTDVDSVLSVIIEYSSKWPSQSLQKFPELKFKYVEEEKPEDFFIPYVWSLVGESSLVNLKSSVSNKSIM